MIAKNIPILHLLFLRKPIFLNKVYKTSLGIILVVLN
jgi:hypothetical protein